MQSHCGESGGISWQSHTSGDGTVGYREAGPALRRTEVAGASFGFIIELGPPLRMGSGCRYSAGFVAAPGSGAMVTEHDGLQEGLQFEIPPEQFFAVMGVHPSEVTGMESLADFAPSRYLAERCAEETTWEGRVACVQRWLRDRIRDREVEPRVLAAARRLRSVDGNVPVTSLYRDLEMSERSFGRRFQNSLGLGPKKYARLLRFGAAIQALRSDPPLCDVAAELGYFDQAHLSREVKAFSGRTPTQLRQDMLTVIL